MTTEMKVQSEFNGSIQVTELLMKTLENCARDFGARCIKECALKHGFNAEEEIRALGLENLTLIRKQMAKKSVGKRSGVKGLGDKSKKEHVVKEKKSVFPMPFVAEKVDLAGCCGLAFNRGLFTQCRKECMEVGKFCKGCQMEADKNASGCPDCGTVESRLSTGLYDFKDPKGRSPVSYVKVLEKLKLTAEQALEEAGKLNIELSEEHFVVLAEGKEKSVKGRPKKAAGVIEADNVTDLFAKLTAEGEDEVVEVDEEKPSKVSKKASLSDEEKAVKKAALEEERAVKKAEREAKIAEEKAEREAKRKADLDQKKQEREAKIAEEKAEREAKRLAEKAEREAKKAAEKSDKGTKKSVAKAEAKVEAKVEATPAPAAKVSVTRIQIGGKQYLKSSNNILYNPDTKEEVGLWDPASKTIKDLPEDDEEEEEEEYDLD